MRMNTPLYAVILGASSGFGKAACLALAEKGYHIIGVHLDRAAGLATVEELKTEITSKGVTAEFFNVNAADATNRATVVEAIKNRCAETGGAVWFLLHSLAFGTLKPFVAEKASDSISQKSIEMTMDVMANSLIYWTQDLVQGGLFSQGGRVASLTSSGSHRAIPTYGAVSAAKAALESYTRQLALELAPYNVTCNTIRAGVTDTPALRKIPGNDRLIANAYNRNPFHKLTTPEDVANVLVLLAQKEAAWINGIVLGVDGGEDSIDLTWWEPQA